MWCKYLSNNVVFFVTLCGGGGGGGGRMRQHQTHSPLALLSSIGTSATDGKRAKKAAVAKFWHTSHKASTFSAENTRKRNVFCLGIPRALILFVRSGLREAFFPEVRYHTFKDAPSKFQRPMTYSGSQTLPRIHSRSQEFIDAPVKSQTLQKIKKVQIHTFISLELEKSDNYSVFTFSRSQ